MPKWGSRIQPPSVMDGGHEEPGRGVEAPVDRSRIQAPGVLAEQRSAADVVVPAPCPEQVAALAVHGRRDDALDRPEPAPVPRGTDEHWLAGLLDGPLDVEVRPRDRLVGRDPVLDLGAGLADDSSADLL